MTGVEVASLLTFLDEFPSAPHKLVQLVLRTEIERKVSAETGATTSCQEKVEARQKDS